MGSTSNCTHCLGVKNRTMEFRLCLVCMYMALSQEFSLLLYCLHLHSFFPLTLNNVNCGDHVFCVGNIKKRDSTHNKALLTKCRVLVGVYGNPLRSTQNVMIKSMVDILTGLSYIGKACNAVLSSVTKFVDNSIGAVR